MSLMISLMKRQELMKFVQFHKFSCLSVIVLRICNAPVIYISGGPRVGDSRDIAGLKCRDFTSDESRQCLFSPPWNRRVKIIQIA